MAAEAAISSAVELLGDLLIQKVKSLRGVEGKVELLKEELKRMQSFLKDANKKQVGDERVNNWISEIREVAQDAQDTIEMFLLNVESAKNWGLLKRCTTFPKRMYHLDRIGDEIESILTRLDTIDKSRERYGIKDLGEAVQSASRLQVESRRRLCPWQKDEHLVGVEDDVKKLLRESIMYKEKKGLSIVVLEGMGGIGKSSLARKIYNHPDVVAGPFDGRAWVVVSSEFTPHETIKQLIFDLPGSDKKKLRELEESMKDKLYVLEKLKEMLHMQLEGKSYFIVLDDVWEKEHFESLITAFPNQQDKASRLLITTRNKIITKYDHYYVHKMKLLDLDKGWELLLKKALIGSSDVKCPEELETVGRQILEKCDGLPLAISVVGGLLVETQTKSGWEQVLNQINSYLGRAESESRVLSILELSYHNLSSQLKSCFLYLAFFKEDSIIPAKRLLNIWDAHGLIQQEGSRTTDEIGRGHLNELINRSMLQIQDVTIDDLVKNCRLHDLLREICLRKAKEEIGLENIIKGEKRISSESSYKPRHRVVYGNNLETCSSNQNKHLRSLFLFNVYNSSIDFQSLTTPFWKSFHLLEMLYLEDVGWRMFPHSFRSLIGLKYLRIRGSSSETLQIPEWFDQLRKLKVVDLRSENVELPEVNLKMAQLRYFSATSVYRLTSIDNWKNIQTLKYISLDDLLRCSSPALLSACPVRELGLFLNRKTEREELRGARGSLEMMTNLVKLQLFWNLSLSVESAMIPRLACLTKLNLRGGMRRCPDSGVFPPNLSYLTLVETFMDEDPMPELGKLSKLQYLKLTDYACLVERMRVLHDGFPSLRGLCLKRIYFLRGIDVEEGGMPQLKLLRIHRCPALETRNLPEHIVASLSSA